MGRIGKNVWPESIGDNFKLGTEVTVDLTQKTSYWRMRRMPWNENQVPDERIKFIAEVWQDPTLILSSLCFRGDRV
jgi:hypothetical protein